MVCGGGPTGVEVAAEMYDMVHDDLMRLYPSVAGKAVISIVDAGSKLLGTYDPVVSAYTGEQFRKAGEWEGVHLYWRCDPCYMCTGLPPPHSMFADLGGKCAKHAPQCCTTPWLRALPRSRLLRSSLQLNQ